MNKTPRKEYWLVFQQDNIVLDQDNAILLDSSAIQKDFVRYHRIAQLDEADIPVVIPTISTKEVR